MTYFNLRKRADEPDPDPEEEAGEEQPEEDEDESEKGKSAKAYGPILTGLLGPGAWISARLGAGWAWGIHAAAVWAVFFYGGRTAVGIILVWLLAVGLFTPREFLDQIATRIEKRTGIHRAVPSEANGEPVEEAPPQPDPQDVLDMSNDIIFFTYTQICDNTDSKYLHAHMIGNYAFLYRAHAYHITSYYLYQLIFCTGFKRRAGYRHIYSFLYIEIIFCRNGFCFFDQFFFIGFAHVRKAWPQLLHIFSNKRIGRKKTYMIFDDHYITHLETGVNTPGGIGKQ